LLRYGLRLRCGRRGFSYGRGRGLRRRRFDYGLRRFGYGRGLRFRSFSYRLALALRFRRFGHRFALSFRRFGNRFRRFFNRLGLALFRRFGYKLRLFFLLRESVSIFNFGIGNLACQRKIGCFIGLYFRRSFTGSEEKRGY
jgi:hypothetical protein